MNHHHHKVAVRLDVDQAAIVGRGLSRLLKLTDGLEFSPLGSERYPLPLSATMYTRLPQPATLRAEVQKYLLNDPVAALDAALVLLELFQSTQTSVRQTVPDDGKFLSLAFSSKRLNGWLALLGDASRAEVETAINTKWQFKFIEDPDGLSRLYVLLNLLCRYGFVYGRIAPGDSHAMGHFVEEFTPGLQVCQGSMNDLELTMSLAAMKLGVPALVPPDYPFPLGRRVTASTMDEVVSGVTLFPNIRRLLDLPDVPQLPACLNRQYAEEDFLPTACYGATDASYYVLRKGSTVPGRVEVAGIPGPDMGVVLTAEAEPLDAFDRQYIEAYAAGIVNMLKGVRSRTEKGRLIVETAPDQTFDATRLGEVLVAAIRHEFPKIENVSARIVFDSKELTVQAPAVHGELVARQADIAAATEATMEQFLTCVGCSAFAPDHVCVLTPERMPQCGRPYGMIRTGALYGYDDMTNIHHRSLHAGLNSFGITPKGDALDEVAGEWEGVNEAVSRLSGGRTTRVQLHSLAVAPHTGCGCFGLIMFKTDLPRPGVAIMDRGYKGASPDGRTWRDLHYALGGKQTPGMAGAASNYLRSRKFLAAHGGWESVVWVSPKIGDIMGGDLPMHVEVGK